MEFKKLKDIAEINMGQSPKSEFFSQESGMPFLQGNRTFNLIYPTIDTFTTKVTKLADKGDILFSVRAPVGDINIAPSEVCIGRGLCAIKSKDNNQKFLFYLLKNIKDIENFTSGTIFSSINKVTLENLEIKVPDIDKQKKIGTLLWKLDDMILNNNKIINNLEQISQTLFKRWFIDFEFPNEEGQPYKSSGGKMIESELGEIPEGWEVKKLKDLTLQYKDTFNPKKSEEEEVYHYSLPAYDANSYPVVDKVKEIKSNKWIVEDNCVVFSKMNPKTPRVWLIKEKDDLLNVASSEFVVLKNKSEESNFFIYNVCNNQKFTEYLCSNTTGSTNSRQRVTPTIALDFKLAVNEQIISKFSNLISANGKMILEAAEENKNLEKLRDTLLPKLLSGEIEIPDDLEV